MLDAEEPPHVGGGDGYLELHAAGEPAWGEFRCPGCGYGVAIASALPTCPMCGGASWERVPWKPFARAESPFPRPPA